MSDWSTAFSGFREGMQIGNQRRAQDKAQQLERDRLDLERQRRLDESATSEIQRKLLQRKLNPPEVPIPSDMEQTAMTVDSEGNMHRTFSPKLDATKFMVQPLQDPTGKAAGHILVGPNGVHQFLPNNPLADLLGSQLHGAPSVSPPESRAQNQDSIQPGTEDMPPRNGGLPGVTNRVPVSPPETSGGAGESQRPSIFVSGFDAHGNPTADVRYPGELPKSVKLPSGETTWVTTDPKTGAQVYSPPKREGAPVSQEAQKRLDTMMLLLDNTPRLAQTVTKHAGAGGPVAGPFWRAVSTVRGPSDAQLDFDQAKAQMVALMAKGLLGETGVLSEADMKRYTPMIPAYEDLPAVRVKKIEKLATLLRDSAKNQVDTLKASGVDTGQLESVLATRIKALGSLGSLPVQVRNAEDYAQVPKGSRYTDGSGQVKIKQ